ncbi:MAG: ATP-binding protein [Anaerolineae bacterium]
MRAETVDRERALHEALSLQAFGGTPLRLVVAAGGWLLIRSVHSGRLPHGALASVLLEGLGALLLGLLMAGSWLLARRGRALAGDIDQALLLGAGLLDLVFVNLLVLHSGAQLSEAFILFPLLMLEVALLYPTVPGIVAVAVLAGPTYAGTLYLRAGGWFFLVEPGFIWRYALLLVSALLGPVLGTFAARGQGRARTLAIAYQSSREDLARQTVSLQQTASALSRRVQQLRMLQEGVRAINTSLALEDLLSLIVANAAQVVHGARCTLTLRDDETGRPLIQAVSDMPAENGGGVQLPISQGFAAWVMRHGKAIRINHAADDPRLASLADWPIASCISVPLVADGQTFGALTATSTQEGAFTEEDLEALSAFAAQAVVAVRNAGLYKAAQERRSELEAMLRGIGDAVIATDARLRLTLMNPIAAHIFGLTRPVTAGQPLREVNEYAELVPLFEEALARADLPLRREIVLGAKGEQPARVLQALASPVLGEGGEVRGIVVVLRDISEQRALEQVKTDFLSVVSHELKMPLHAIKGFVDIILMNKAGPVTETQRDFLQTVKQQAEALQIMINDLLEFSRLESGQIRLRIERVLVGQLVRGVVARLAPLAAEANLELINDVPGDLGLIQADEARLEQVLTNLVSNAIKFTPQGSVTVRAYDWGDAVQVSVTDTGIGIPADRLERVFDRFFQVDGSATRAYRGAGLGLTICKHIVEYHGGRIWAESQVGRGSTFHIVLPKTQPSPDQLAMDFTILPPGDTRTVPRRSPAHSATGTTG